MTDRLSTARFARSHQVDRLDGGFDLVVIGGGVVGAGIAVDAATRGLRVATVERDDFASGTSSRSTKLLHGGVRYLPQLQFRLVRESLKEQKVLARIADYLYEPFDFVIPVYRGRGFADAPKWARHPLVFPIALRLGLWFYDRLGSRGRMQQKRRLSVDELRERFPKIRTEGLRHGVRYQDAQTDDARLTAMLAATSVEHGGVAATYVEATALRHVGDRYDIDLLDRLSARTWTIQARTVVSATGAFAPPPGSGDEPLPLILSKGAHLTTTTTALGLTDAALVLPETEDERVMFLVPWHGYAVVGTTDTPYHEDPEHPLTDADDVAYMVRHVEEYLDVDDPAILSSWSGLRVLAGSPDEDTARASREHVLVELHPGYVQVAGGKLTGYRKIAEDAVDRVLKHLGEKGIHSRTDHVPIVGAGVTNAVRVRVEAAVARMGLPDGYDRTLLGRYGTAAEAVLRLMDDRPELLETVGGDLLTLAEVVHMVRNESAATITDVVQRRTRLAWFTEDHARGSLEIIGRTMAAELGWDADRLAAELHRVDHDLTAEGL
ncbi:MAG: glycerol-3-phosphate dehydrogenase/oxidase [Acidimicrobiia bacterium]|nr:glycerol-3-phosphate dehydrogenase/oxidase [Acidimicrobiia bacterium]